MIAAVTLLVLLGGMTEGALPQSPRDAVIRDVLELVQRTHVDPAAAEPLPVLRGAALAARARRPDVAFTEADGALRVTIGREELELRPVEAGALSESAGPGLELLLDALTGDAESERNAWRSTLLDGALKALDRWSGAATGRKRMDQQVRREGRLAGIGVRIGRRDGALRIVAVGKASGAADAGLRTGDEILQVDCRDVDGLPVSQVLALLRGRPGTRAAVLVRRLAPAAVEAERRAIPQSSVTRARRADGIGIVTIDHFSRETPREASRALSALRAEGPLAGLIIDLRGNSGGSMLGAAGVADLFVDEGVLAEALDARDQAVAGLRPRVDASPGGELSLPLAVLVDRRTASSAELLAASLAWNGRAVIAGETTFGKVVVGKPHVFDACDLTVTITSAVMRAAGRRLPAEGIAPDVTLAPSEAAVLNSLAALLLAHGRASRESMLAALRADISGHPVVLRPGE